MSDDMKGPIIFIWIMAIAMMINLCTVVSRSEAGVLSGLKCHKLNEQTTRESYDVLIQHVLFSLNKEHPCLLYTSPSPRDRQKSRMPSSA